MAGILLAAGHSRRFGAEDKLLASFRGKPLVTHAADALRALKPAFLIAVVSSPDVAKALPDFECVAPKGAVADQSASLVAGVDAAAKLDATRAVVVLGDMPFIKADVLRAVCNRCGLDQAAAVTVGNTPFPPACFPRSMFADLTKLAGDYGARAMLKKLPASQLVTVHEDVLREVDTPADLTRLGERERRQP